LSLPVSKAEKKENLKVLAGKIGYAKNQLKKLESEILLKQQLVADMEAVSKGNSKHLSRDNRELLRANQELKDELKTLKDKLNDVNASIAERKAYLAEQEKNVELAVDEFNISFREKQADLATIDNQHNEKLSQLADLDELLAKSTEGKVAIEQKRDMLQKFYDEQVAKMKVEIRVLTVEKEQADIERKRSINNLKEIMEKLSAKERELASREEILEVREEQLRLSEKQMEMARSLQNKKGVRIDT